MALKLQIGTIMDTPKTEQAQHKDEKEKKVKKSASAYDEPNASDLVGEEEQLGSKGSVKVKAKHKNNVRKLRMERMMSKAELARRAGLSTLTVDRVEKGMPCRMDTKRKILEALGLTPSDRVTVFGEDY